MTTPNTHSTFSASASHRLLSCPGSFKLGQDFDKGRTSSIYAAEGTLAHAVSEACIEADVSPETFLGQRRQADGFDFTIDEDFAYAVGVYVDFVQGLKAVNYQVWLERRVSPQQIWKDLAPLDIDLFGTSDCIAYDKVNKHLVIGDLKFGRGVAVSALNNTQLRYYATGAINFLIEHGVIAPYEQEITITTTIIQPRALHPAGPIRSETIQLSELKDWARLNLYEGVKRAINDNGKTFEAGSWCKFCPALARCGTLAKLSLDVARRVFAAAPLENIPSVTPAVPLMPQNELTDDELGALLDRVEILTPWLAAVKDLALVRLERNQNIPGWKAVPKRASRRWVDAPEEILKRLDSGAALTQSQYSTRELMTPAQIERAIGKPFYQQHIAPLVSKTSSGLTLVCEGDPRARARTGRSAREAFTNNPATTT